MSGLREGPWARWTNGISTLQEIQELYSLELFVVVNLEVPLAIHMPCQNPPMVAHGADQFWAFSDGLERLEGILDIATYNRPLVVI